MIRDQAVSVPACSLCAWPEEGGIGELVAFTHLVEWPEMNVDDLLALCGPHFMATADRRAIDIARNST